MRFHFHLLDSTFFKSDNSQVLVRMWMTGNSLQNAGINISSATTLKNIHSLVKKIILLDWDSQILLLDSHHRENLKHVDLEMHTRMYIAASFIKKKLKSLNVHQQKNENKLWYIHSRILYSGENLMNYSWCHNVDES